MVRQNLLVTLRNLVSWNISCWHPLHTGRDSKLTTVRKHLRKGPVCLQETKWTDAMAIGLQQRLPAVRVVSTSAIQTEQGGLSGGTAILIPTSLEVLEVQEIVKGRILGVLVSSRTSKFWIYSVYLHPVSKASFFCCERLSASMARSLHLSFICIPQSTRALDQGGVEPRQAVSPKALRPWTIPLRYSVGSSG